MRGGHGDDSLPEHNQPTVEDDFEIETVLGHIEQGGPSNTSNHQQTDAGDGLGRLRARLDAIKIKEEEAEARFKGYYEATRQERKALEEAEAIERIVRQERADLERRNTERAREEARLRVEQVGEKALEERRNEEGAAVAERIVRQKRKDLERRVQEHAQLEAAYPQAEQAEGRPAERLRYKERGYRRQEFTPRRLRDRWVFRQPDPRAEAGQAGDWRTALQPGASE